MSLAQEHLEDLYASGLDDATIAKCGFESVRPADIALAGVTSAYKIPYYNLDGSKNCFERLKIFPPIVGQDGHQQKYHQLKDTPPNLYLSPLIDWKAVAGDVQTPIVFAEGEKKSASLCQRGIAAVGIAGVWNWRQKLDTGERMVIPSIDQFVWENRRIELAPDSDVWRKDKISALCGFFAFSMVLAKLCAHAVFVILADERGRKMGADDFAVSRNGDFEHQWPMLSRIALDDQRLIKAAKWYQDWTAKQNAQQALRDQTDHDLVLTEAVGLFTLKSEKHALVLAFDNLHARGNSIIAELSIVVAGRILRSHTDITLKNDEAQAKLARNLHALIESVPWKVLIPQACALVLQRYREGAPIVRIDKHSVAEPLSFIVNPLVMKNKPTILFATGGQGKSMLALFISLLVSTGGSHAGLSTIKGKSLYCDFEDDEPVFINRRHALQAGHPELADAFIDYLPCTQPLARMTHTLARTIQREGITFLVIDSLLKAAGGGSDAEATENLFAALRILNVATLIIGHTPKPQTDGPSAPSIYGSVFSGNFARSVWEFQLEAEAGEDSSLISLVNHKTNLTRKHLPLGLKITYEAGGSRIRYESHDVQDSTELKKSLPVPSQIRNLLEDGLLRTAKGIADELGLPLNKVKSPLSKYAGHKWMAIIHEGQETQYTVLNPRHGGVA